MPKTWFITGASRGFGREFTEAALARGDGRRRWQRHEWAAERTGVRVAVLTDAPHWSVRKAEALTQFWSDLPA